MALRLSRKTRRKSLIPELKSNREKLLQASGFALLLLVCVFHLRAAFLAQLAANNSANALYFSGRLTEPNALARLARNEFLAKANLPKALALYTRALENHVLHIPSWLGLVELYNDMGEKDKAVAALQFVQNFAAGNERTAWTTAILAHELDQPDLMVANLVWLATKFPVKRRQVFALADQRWPDAHTLMGLFDQSLSPDILEYYIGINDAPKAATAWQRLADTGTGDQKIALRYINYLLGLEKVPEAVRIWQAFYRKEGELLNNRELKEPFIGSGFGWRISKSEGVSWQQADGEGGLRIQFDGSENASFNLLQIVPLAPGQYVFSGTIAAQDLTTDQRPYWVVSGYQCDGLSVKGEMPRPSSPAEPFSLEFSVPEGCHAVQLLFRRASSYYFDNKISGVVTIRDLDLAPVAPVQQGTVQQGTVPQGIQVLPTAKKAAKPAKAGRGKGSIDINKIQIY